MAERQISLPSADDLAWLDYLLSVGAGRLTELVETLEALFRESPPNEMTLERLGGFLLLSRSAASSGQAVVDKAEELAYWADSVYQEREDTGEGLVSTVAGVEPYTRYRSRIAERYAAEAQEAGQ